MLQAMKQADPDSVKDLSKEVWSSRKEGNGAILLHFKGAKGKGYSA
jgi:deoxyxylulose-5-phosphate synthase